MSAAGPPQGANRAPSGGSAAAKPQAWGDHTSAPAPPMSRHGTTARNKRILALLAAIALAPVVLSYLAYYAWPRDARVNYGRLLEGHPAVAVTGTRLDGTPFDVAELRGRWIVLHAAPGACRGECPQSLYASRQARTMQNAERERVVRLWLVTDQATPASALLAEHSDLSVVHADPRAAATLPEGAGPIYLVDPLGNFVLAWPSQPDIKGVAKDLGRLLRASSIG